MPQGISAAVKALLADPDRATSAPALLEITYADGTVERLTDTDHPVQAPRNSTNVYMPGDIVDVSLAHPECVVAFAGRKAGFVQTGFRILKTELVYRSCLLGDNGYTDPFFLFRGILSKPDLARTVTVVTFADPMYALGNSRPFILTPSEQERRVDATTGVTADTSIDSVADHRPRARART